MMNGGLGAPLEEAWMNACDHSLAKRASPGSSKKGKKKQNKKIKKTSPSMEASAHVAPSADQLCDLYETGVMNPMIDNAMNFHQDVSGGAQSCNYDGPGLGGGYVTASAFDDPRYLYAATYPPSEPTNNSSINYPLQQQKHARHPQHPQHQQRSDDDIYHPYAAPPGPGSVPYEDGSKLQGAMYDDFEEEEDGEDEDEQEQGDQDFEEYEERRQHQQHVAAKAAIDTLETFDASELLESKPAPTATTAAATNTTNTTKTTKADQSVSGFETGQIADIALYVLSGVLLIFILEQFVQLGVTLK